MINQGENLKFDILEGRKVISSVSYVASTGEVSVVNHDQYARVYMSDDATYDDVEYFLKSRVFSMSQSARDFLSAHNIDINDELSILRVSKGRLEGDKISVKIYI